LESNITGKQQFVTHSNGSLGVGDGVGVTGVDVGVGVTGLDVGVGGGVLVLDGEGFGGGDELADGSGGPELEDGDGPGGVVDTGGGVSVPASPPQIPGTQFPLTGSRF